MPLPMPVPLPFPHLFSPVVSKYGDHGSEAAAGGNASGGPASVSGDGRTAQPPTSQQQVC